MRFLRSNTAVKITIGPFLDHADGLTPLTTMTESGLEGAICYDADDGDAVTLVGAAHFHPSHHDAAGDNDMLYLAAGLWEMELTAAQTNYTGRMMLSLTDATQICPVFHEFQVLAANVYDSLFAGHGVTADLLKVSVEAVHGTALTETGAGYLAGSIVKFFDKQTPTGTINSLPDAVAGAANGLPVIDATGAKLTKTVDLTAGQTIAITRPTGAVATDAGNSATVFKTNLTSATNDFWVGAWVKITSGDLLGQVRKISDYDGANKIVTVAPAFTGTPADAVTFVIVNE